MNQTIRKNTSIFQLQKLEESSLNQLTQKLQELPGEQAFSIDREKHQLYIYSDQPINDREIIDLLYQRGFSAQPINNHGLTEQKLEVRIEGMTCHSCEVLIERAWKHQPGIKKVEVNAAKGRAYITTDGQHLKLTDLQHAIGNGKYRVREISSEPELSENLSAKRPTFGQLIVLFASVFLLGTAFSKLGLLNTSFAAGAGLTFGAVFLVGLIAASSSCVAVTGGLLLSAAATFNQRYASIGFSQKMRPVMMFVAGRIAGYGVLGGVLGLLGSSFTISPTVTGIIMLMAALYMLTMGLEMLHLAPSWLKGLMPKMPKSFSHKIMDAQGNSNPVMPFILGAATFFLPCGFTQSLQLYALTTGSFMTSGLIMFGFALGTAPALLALGLASSSFKGKLGTLFYQFSGALVVVLGLWNIQNGLTIMGRPIPIPKFTAETAAQEAKKEITNDGEVQVVKMAVTDRYVPDRFTVKAGIPVRWEIDGTDAQGCGQFIMSKQIGLQRILENGVNVVNFTPKEPGTINFACSMGMFRGSFKVVE